MNYLKVYEDRRYAKTIVNHVIDAGYGFRWN